MELSLALTIIVTIIATMITVIAYRYIKSRIDTSKKTTEQISRFDILSKEEWNVLIKQS